MVYLDDPNAILEVQPNADITKVEWWNGIQFMEDNLLCENFGIQSPEIFLKMVDYFDKDLSTRYFYISEIDRENISKYTRLYKSDVTNWLHIFCDTENEKNIKSLITNKEVKPSFTSLLKLSSSIVNIQIGGDEEYLDYLLIQSATDISDLIDAITQKLHSFIEEYENLLQDCKPFDNEWQVDFYKYKYLEIIKNYD